MRPLLLNTYDTAGGAAIATNRIHRGLLSIGVDSQLLVMHKGTADPTVIQTGARTILQKIAAYIPSHSDERLTRQLHASGVGLFSPARRPDQLGTKLKELDPDVVHLFWINAGFMQIESLKRFKKPIVWTLHDMWPFTGGCHYDNDCGKFRESCGNCPLLDSNREHDLSRLIWERKHTSWGDMQIVVVATSNWMANMARESSLFKDQQIEVIPNGIDTNLYKPIDKNIAREVLGLPIAKKLVLFSAFNAVNDSRKGNQFLTAAIGEMTSNNFSTDFEVVIVGAPESTEQPNLGTKFHFMGYLRDEVSQILLYSAADVLVAPSVQENLSNAVMESLACGTPVVAFNIGGMPDMIDHCETGYLAQSLDSRDLAAGIRWVIDDKERQLVLSRQARERIVNRYAMKTIAGRYGDLYKSLLP